MAEIPKLLDELNRLCDSAENRRRLSLWDDNVCGIRAEAQWHGVPNYTTAAGNPMPVTVECLEKIWQELLGLQLAKYYTDPQYYLEYYLKMRLIKFKEFPDDTPLTRDIPVFFGVTHEAGLLGQKIYLDHGEEPAFSNKALINESSDLSKPANFVDNPFLNMAIPFYEKIKSMAGSEFHVIFPLWYRGPQGVALYIRGFQEFCLDLYLNQGFAHKILRYVTKAAKDYMSWRSNYLGEPLEKGDLFNDDIPLTSPDSYEEFFLPYEQELANFFGGIYYWHSCGDITNHISVIQKLSNMELLDFGVSMENKSAGLEILQNIPVIELRVFAKPYVQECSEEESKEYVRTILNGCAQKGIDKYIIRSSGMSVVLGGKRDIDKLARWVDLVREVLSEDLYQGRLQT